MKEPNETVVLAFNKCDKMAYVVTDGQRHAVYTNEGRQFAPRLSTAIARLEAQGYLINNDMI